MKERWLNIINVLGVIAALAVVASMWFYVREQFMWGIILAILIISLLVWINIRKLFFDRINVRRKAGGKAEYDPAGDRLLQALNYASVIAILAIGAFFWIYMREQVTWGIYLIVLILIVLVFINVLKMFSLYMEK
ncbi:hypothetical protein CUJ83_02855 [Methanocella sp. CWC-04]|uniref:DUF2178 domain-containing protein n=2 Tax=Methanooceanicella nereidis TaxID=2052831 RepID=A0AAP2RDD9_9EURY|nr:hypothetical protein [Methanocella sp. CWC-04]